MRKKDTHIYMSYTYMYINIYRVGEEFTGKLQGIKKINVRCILA